MPLSDDTLGCVRTFARAAAQAHAALDDLHGLAWALARQRVGGAGAAAAALAVLADGVPRALDFLSGALAEAELRAAGGPAPPPLPDGYACLEDDGEPD